MGPMRKIISICMVLGSAVAAQAHNLHQSTGEITARGTTVQWDIIAHDRDVERFFHKLSITPERLKPLVSRRIVVENNGTACPLSSARMDPSTEEAHHYKIALRFECATPVSQLALYYNLLFGQRDHVHTATVQLPGSTPTIQFDAMHTSRRL